MKYKKLYAVAGIILLATVIFFNISKKPHYPEHISETFNGAPSEAPSDLGNPTVATINTQTYETILENISIINHETLNEFKFLQHKFRKSINLDDHLDKIKEYLLSSYDAEYAETIFETYKTWLNCEMAVIAEFGELSSTRSPLEIADMLKSIHEFRITNMGEQLADSLYGAELKIKLYSLNYSSIENNDELYGEEKETLIEGLDLSYPDIGISSSIPYDNYRKKLKLFQRDLSEVDSIDDREEIIKQIREATLPHETVKKLELIDEVARQNKAKEELYSSRKKMLLSDSNISSDEKENRLNVLRTEIFSPKGAQTKARMENLEKGYQKIISGLKTEE